MQVIGFNYKFLALPQIHFDLTKKFRILLLFKTYEKNLYYIQKFSKLINLK